MKSLIALSSNREPTGELCRRAAHKVDLTAGGRRCHPVDPDLEPAFAVEIAIGFRHRMRDPGIVNARQSLFQHQILGGQQPPLQIAPGRGCYARPTRLIAPSMKTPVGRPSESRRIWPSAGAVDSLPTLARRIASEFAQPA